MVEVEGESPQLMLKEGIVRGEYEAAFNEFMDKQTVMIV